MLTTDYFNLERLIHPGHFYLKDAFKMCFEVPIELSVDILYMMLSHTGSLITSAVLIHLHKDFRSRSDRILLRITEK
jgi:hypothetical protein